MKKFFILFILLSFLVVSSKVFAVQKPIPFYGYEGCYTGYKYVDGGGFYTDINLPYITGNSINLYEQKDVRGKIIPISRAANESKLNIETLKRGTSSRTNYMFVVEVGDAGILKAAKNGGITKIHFVEVNKEKLYVPFIFIPTRD